MANIEKYPGLYIEELNHFSASVIPVETSMPLFIGYTEKDTSQVAHDRHLLPTRVASFPEYERVFGAAQGETNIVVTINETRDAAGHILTQSVTAAFKTGGAPAAPLRSPHILSYAMRLFFANGGGACYIVSVGLHTAAPGVIRLNELINGLNAAGTENGPTMIVIPEAQGLCIADFATLQDAALKQCAERQDRFVIMDVHGNDASPGDSHASLRNIIETFRTRGVGTENLKYGAAYAPNIETTVTFAFDDAAVEVVIVTNGSVQPTAPRNLTELKSLDLARYGQAIGAIREIPCVMPPSSTVAGVYVLMDTTRGVWKAPANVALNLVTKPAIQYDTTLQDEMNVSVTGKSVNGVRQFPGRGTLVWGARTLDGNSTDWRYVNVRRFMTFVETSVRLATESFVFEPNDARTWTRVQAMIENFLQNLWTQGGLMGDKPERAFFVHVGLGKTMTAQDILDGRLNIEIGVAVVRPAEFTVLAFSLKMIAAS